MGFSSYWFFYFYDFQVRQATPWKIAGPVHVTAESDLIQPQRVNAMSKFYLYLDIWHLSQLFSSIAFQFLCWVELKVWASVLRLSIGFVNQINVNLHLKFNRCWGLSKCNRQMWTSTLHPISSLPAQHKCSCGSLENNKLIRENKLDNFNRLNRSCVGTWKTRLSVAWTSEKVKWCSCTVLNSRLWRAWIRKHILFREFEFLISIDGSQQTSYFRNTARMIDSLTILLKEATNRLQFGYRCIWKDFMHLSINRSTRRTNSE